MLIFFNGKLTSVAKYSIGTMSLVFILPVEVTDVEVDVDVVGQVGFCDV